MENEVEGVFELLLKLRSLRGRMETAAQTPRSPVSVLGSRIFNIRLESIVQPDVVLSERSSHRLIQ